MPSIHTATCADCGKTRTVKAWRAPKRCLSCARKWASRVFNPQDQFRFVGPYRGRCGICGGPDARHRIADAARSRYDAGESVRSIARDLGLQSAALKSWLERT